MNSTFKVVFNKARGALMVVNEVTSSVQAKGTKTVVAAAVATMIAGVAGTAMAEEVAEPSEPAAKTTIVINNATTQNDLTKYAAMDFDGYVSSNASGHLGGAVLIKDDKAVTFDDGVKFTNNTSEKSGGAIEVQAGTVTLKDAVITGNKADTWGGAIRMAGNSMVNLTVTKDTVYSGNKANANGKLDYPDMGDFVYMNGATTDQKTALNLKAEGDATLTVADSIASAGSNNEITTEGKVNVTGSMEAYTGDITVKKGSEFTLAGGFGSYDLWTDSNNRDYNSLSQSKLKVEGGGKASLGDLKITRRAIVEYNAVNKKPTSEARREGTILEVAEGGELSVNSITVTSQKYSDKFTSYGKGKLSNHGTATVKDHITVEAGAEFAMTGDVTAGRIVTAAKTDNLAAGFIKHTEGTLTLNNGKSVNNGKVELDKVVLDNGAVLETSVQAAKFAFNELALNEGTTLNVTEFNSNHFLGLGNKKEDGKEYAKDQWLVTNKVVLNGGTLAYKNGSLDNIKVGMNSDVSAQLVVNADYSFKNVTIGKSGIVNVNADGTITTETLHLSKGNVSVNGGSLTVTGNKGFTVFKGTDGSTPALTLANGTFTVDAGSLFKEQAAAETAADAKKTYEATDAAKVIMGTGTVNVTSKAFEYSLGELREGQELLNNQGRTDIKLVLANGTLKLGKDEELNANGVNGLNLAGHTGVAGESADSAFAVTQTTTIGAIDFNAVKNKKATGITLNNTAALTLAGNGGDVFKNLGAKVTTVTTGDLVLGTAGNSGNVNVENLDANTLTVVGAFDAENVSFKADSSIKEGALLDVAKLTSEQNKMAVAGTLVADVIGANVTVDESGVLVLGERQLAPSTRALLAETPAAPEFVDQIQKVVTANKAGALVTTNMQGEALFAAAAGDLFDAEKNVGLYVDHTIGVDDTTGKLIVGNPIEDKRNGTVAIAKDAVVVIDTKKFGAEDTVFDAKLYLSGDAPVILSGLTTNTSFILATETGSGDAKPGINLIDNNVFFKGDLNKAENGSLIVSTVFNDKVTDDAELNDVIKTQLDGSHNQKNADVLAAIADTTKKAGLVNKEGTALTDKGVQAVEEYLVAPLTAGALNLAYDATAQVNAVVENRVLEKADGVWADVFYASNKDSERYGDFGYSADITGGTLGVDTTVSCGAKIGAAFTIGQGDADSEGTVHGYSTDADFYGISLYAGRNVADTSLRISGNLSYLMFENDIKGSVAGASADESLDGKAFTAGLRADWTAYEGAFTVAPHAGLRYTFLEMDDYRDLEIGDMNVVEMPFGVKVSGAFEPAAGWTLQPSVDFTVVPQLGDKDVDTVLGSVDVIDNLYNTELGVEAATGNFSFGLSYKYGFGKEDRKNQSLNLNARYMF